MTIRNRAETLLEAIIAVSILTLIIVPAAGAYVASVQNRSFSRNHLLATAFAEEGVEILGNFRDTNLLKFSAKGRDCWDTKPDSSITVNNCSNLSNKIGSFGQGPVTFLLMENPETLEWSLGQPGPTSDFRLRFDPATSFYFSPPVGLENRGTATNFSRRIIVEYLDTNVMKIMSLVEYPRGGTVYTLKRTKIFTNTPS